MSAFAWDLPDPFVIDRTVEPGHIDNYGHVNNAVYITWLDACAWEHSAAVGITKEDCDALGRGMVVWKTQVDYIQPCFEGEAVQIGNWITLNDGRLRADRRFQIVRPADGATLLRALIHFVCVDIATGRPRRMPESFPTHYPVLPQVAEVLAQADAPFLPGVAPERRASR
jgi:acyl-CoA thioester hydrolase